MTRVTRLVGDKDYSFECAAFIDVKWARKENVRRCKFPALWRIDGRNFCTRHGGLTVLTQLANEEADRESGKSPPL